MVGVVNAHVDNYEHYLFHDLGKAAVIDVSSLV